MTSLNYCPLKQPGNWGYRKHQAVLNLD